MKLLETLGTETDRQVRNKISHAVAEVARQYTDNSESAKKRNCPKDWKDRLF